MPQRGGKVEAGGATAETLESRLDFFFLLEEASGEVEELVLDEEGILVEDFEEGVALGADAGMGEP